jgi:twitching motility two-component system response regulator PilH
MQGQRPEAGDDRQMAIRTILVADDSGTDRHLLREILQQAGYRVVLAENGEQAIAMAHKEYPDLILMDVVMPGINGFEATRTLTRDGKTRHIPVIICSSKNQETDKLWGMRQGAHAYLAKPVGKKELLAAIAALGRSSC